MLVADEVLEGFRFCKLLHYSSLKNRGRSALDEALHEGLKWLREQQGIALIGRGRLRVKQHLETLRDTDGAVPTEQRRFCTVGQRFSPAVRGGNGDVSSPEYLLEYLHYTGVIFYRKGLFNDNIILDQGWALEAVYAVFHREKCYGNCAS